MNRVDEDARALFTRILRMDLQSATILVENGITSLEEVAYIPFDELLSIRDLQELQLRAWRERAREHLISGTFDDDGEPHPVTALKPLDPLAGGASAPIEENESN